MAEGPGEESDRAIPTSAETRSERVAVITGSGRAGSIGWSVAHRVAREGFKVVTTRREGSDSVPEDVPDGGTVLGVDVANPVSLERLVRDALGWGGRIDAWVNCAGRNQERRNVEDISNEQWEGILAVNLTSVFQTARLLAPIFRTQGAGVLVNVASRLGKVGEAGFTPYVASKFGVIGLTQALAREWAAWGARVYAVCPGVINTPMSAAFVLSEANRQGKPVEEVRTDVKKLIPLGRFGRAEEVANVIAFLVTDQASYMTGESINVSGGRWVH
jgi:NAD(P)-dependent dehydrogenase (short-subunit alcohol dehydrogenase family)